MLTYSHEKTGICGVGDAVARHNGCGWWSGLVSGDYSGRLCECNEYMDHIPCKLSLSCMDWFGEVSDGARTQNL